MKHYRITIDVRSKGDLSLLYPLFRGLFDKIETPDIVVSIDNQRAIEVAERAAWKGHYTLARNILDKLLKSSHRTQSLTRAMRRTELYADMEQEHAQSDCRPVSAD